MTLAVAAATWRATIRDRLRLGAGPAATGRRHPGAALAEDLAVNLAKDRAGADRRQNAHRPDSCLHTDRRVAGPAPLEHSAPRHRSQPLGIATRTGRHFGPHCDHHRGYQDRVDRPADRATADRGLAAPLTDRRNCHRRRRRLLARHRGCAVGGGVVAAGHVAWQHCARRCAGSATGRVQRGHPVLRLLLVPFPQVPFPQVPLHCQTILT